MIVWQCEGIGKFGKYRHYGPFPTEKDAQDRAVLALLKNVRIYPREVTKR